MRQSHDIICQICALFHVEGRLCFQWRRLPEMAGRLPAGMSRPKRRARIAFWGNFGTLNLGNECTLAAAVINIRRRVPDAQLLSICRNPADTASRHALVAIPIGAADPEPSRLPRPLRMLRRIRLELVDWLRTLRHARHIDSLLITGTGILTDAGEGALGLPYELFKWSLATRVCGGRLLFISVGTESIDRPLARILIRMALRLANYRCYRDRHSMQLMQSFGFPAQRDTIRPDLAFSLPLPAVLHSGGAPSRAVAVGLFNYRSRGAAGGVAATEYATYVDRICSLILWLLERGYAVRVIIGDLAYDEGVRADVRARLHVRGLDLDIRSFADEPATSFEQLLAQLASVDFVIASRYHNVLLSLLLGKPVVSVSYEAKNEALMQDMGLGRYCQTLDALDLPRLTEQFLELEKSAADLLPGMAARAAVNRDLLERQYDLIVGGQAGAAGGTGAL